MGGAGSVVGGRELGVGIDGRRGWGEEGWVCGGVGVDGCRMWGEGSGMRDEI